MEAYGAKKTEKGKTMIKKVKGNVIWLLLLIVGWLIAKPYKRKERRIIDWTEVEVLLKRAFGEKCVFFLVDQKYKVPTLENVKKFLVEDKTDEYRYVPEWLDCDDFSFRLMGQFSYPGWSDIAFGIAVSQVHAYNCVIAERDGKMEVYLIEPQTDEVFRPENFRDTEYGTVFVMM